MTAGLPTVAASTAPQPLQAGRILEAVAYLSQCHAAGMSFGIVTGSDPAELSTIVNAFVSGLPGGVRVARMPAPTDSSQAFLEAALMQLGVEPFESTADDLRRILGAVLRQTGEQGVGTVIVLEDAHEFGPRVLETVRDIARSSRPFCPRPLFVLAGDPGLRLVIDSRGMAAVAHLTRFRFDLSTADASTWQPACGERDPGADVPASAASLVLGQGTRARRSFELASDRLLIGRSQHCDICLPGRYVSREHALLIRKHDGDWLVDLRSTNGTTVNSRTVHARRLRHGDVIAVADCRLIYEVSTVSVKPEGALPHPVEFETAAIGTRSARRYAAVAASIQGRPTPTAA